MEVAQHHWRVASVLALALVKIMSSIWGKISGVINFAGGVTGLLAFASVLVWGGEYKRQTDVNTRDIAQTKSDVAALRDELVPALNRHVSSDDERVSAMKEDIKNSRDQIRELLDIKISIGKLDAKMDALKESLEEHKKAK